MTISSSDSDFFGVIATGHLPILYDKELYRDERTFVIATDHLPILYDRYSERL